MSSKLRYPGLVITAMVITALVVAACGGGDPTPAPTARPQTQQPTATPAPTATLETAATAEPAPARPTAMPAATPKPVPTATPAGPQIVRGGTLNFWMTRDPSNMDINRQRSSANWMSVLPQMNWLVENFQIRGQINPDLAEQWSVSDDGKVWTFNLVKNAKWHDGETVNVDDVIWTLRRITENIDGKVPNPPYKGSLEFITNLERPDDFTLVVTLDRVSASFLPILGAIGNVIYPEHVPISEFEQKRPVGSGPFVWDDWKSGDAVTFTANPNYFKKDAAGRQLPYLDGIKISIIAEATLGLAAYRTGKIDITFPFASILKGQTGKLAQEVPGTSFGGGEAWDYLTFRSGKAPWDDPNVRKAIHLAIDRQFVNDALELGEGSIYRFLSPPGSKWGLTLDEIRALPGYNPDTKQADIAEAKRLLDAAGVNPSDIKLSIPVRDIYQIIGEVSIAQLNEALGFGVKINLMDSATTVDVQFNGSFDIYASRNGGFMDDPISNIDPFVRSTSGLNYGRWGDPQVDAVLDEIDAELDFTKRRQLSRDLELRLIDLAWYVVIGGSKTPIAWPARVKNFDIGGAQDGPPWRFEDIWLEN